jgi:hypothetical protein
VFPEDAPGDAAPVAPPAPEPAAAEADVVDPPSAAPPTAVTPAEAIEVGAAGAVGEADQAEATDQAVAIPMPPPGTAIALTDADAPRPPDHSGRHLVAPIPLPMVVPQGPASLAGPQLERGSGELTRPADPLDAPGPPYVGSTLAAHQVAPVPRLLGRRPRVRRVTRVVRHVDPWSVFKVAIVFNLVLYVVLLTAGVLLWNVAYATGTVDNLERFFESFGWSTFEFHGGAIFHAAWIAGLFGVIGLTGVAVLAATLFNLITDLVGGVRMTVLEEEVQERTMAPMRRFVVRRPTAPGAGDPSSGLRRESDRLPEPHVPNGDQ